MKCAPLTQGIHLLLNRNRFCQVTRLQACKLWRAVDQFSCLTAYHRISAIHPLIITYSGVATRRLRAPITALKKLRPALPLIAVLL